MVSKEKKELVEKIVARIKEYPIVGLVNMENLPAQQLQKMRAMLRDKEIDIVMTRKKLIDLALTQSGKENIGDLVAKIKGMPALLFSKNNPFALNTLLQKNKSPAPAKAGQILPRDVEVKAGPTSFAPGPIISELASVGIKTKVENGKLAIISDTTVAREGDTVSSKLAETLKRLDIQPMEVGLDLVAVWENGLVFEAKQLHIDEGEYLAKITQAAQWAINLSVESAYPTSDTTEMIVQKAFRDAKLLGIEQNIINDVTRNDILARAEAQAMSVKKQANL
jgi:large subunit ribosomal protein L10